MVAPRLSRLAFGHALVLHLLGCTYPSDNERLLRTASRDFSLERTVPAGGAIEVSVGSTVDLYFDAPPDADTAVAANVRVFAGLIETAGTVETDLLDQRVRFRPARPLRPELRHQVYVHGTLSGLNGARLGDTVVFNFTTGEEGRLPPSPQGSAPATAVSLQPLWDGRCAACHAPPAPPAGLDLSTTDAALRSLWGVPSTYGERLRVVPGVHAKSYLMLKLLGAGGYVGFPMPPIGPNVSHGDLRRIASWIDGGATP